MHTDLEMRASGVMLYSPLRGGVAYCYHNGDPIVKCISCRDRDEALFESWSPRGSGSHQSGLPSEPSVLPIGGPMSPHGVLHQPLYLEGATERYRLPEYDETNGFHMNYEILVPGIKKPIINKHIPMDRD